MSFRIQGTGMSVPKRIVTNEELSHMVDTSDEWISQRVGIRQRHICTTETTLDLAVEAAERALESSGTAKEDLDLILAATVSGDTVSPSLSCMVQKRLGVHCMAFDISAACSAFLFLMETAAAFFDRGRMKKILILGAERLSRIVDWEDRSTCIIFGDGAGAAVLSRGEGYLDAEFQVEGDDSAIRIPFYHGKSPFSVLEPMAPYVFMDGQKTYRYAVHSMIRDMQSILARNGFTIENVDYIIPHQANRRIIEAAAKRLKIPLERFQINIDRYGNTSSASIPIALDELRRSGSLKRGDLLLFTAFGGGLAGGAALVRW